jgi:hypothetical protein
MKQLKLAGGQGAFGPFNSIKVLSDRYLCDGIEYQFSVIGAATVEDFVAPPVDLAPAKAAKNQLINEWRLAANQTTFPYAGKLIACDALSRSDIDAVAGSVGLSGEFRPGFPGAWKAVDNSYVALPNIAAFKAMYAAMVDQGTANFMHSQTLKAALAAAETIEQIDEIVW